MDGFDRLDTMRFRVWNDVREAVLRLCCVELHNYDSIRKGLFAEKRDKMTGLLPHCSLRRFSAELNIMTAVLRAKNIEMVRFLTNLPHNVR